MTKYIFVDLDECLFHCRPLGELRQSDLVKARILVNPTEKLINARDDQGDDFYASKLRSGAHDLLRALREVPDSRVSVLTSSVSVYANANNEAHDLGFKPDEIFAREQIQAGVALDPDRFGSGPVYLIDNLPRHDNRIKLNFLRAIATNAVKYIKVPEFWGMDGDAPFSQEYIQEIVSSINDLRNF